MNKDPFQKKMTTLSNFDDKLISFLSENTENVLEAWKESDLRKDLIKLLAKKTKNAVKKDPLAPKRGKTAYLCFFSAQRQEIAKSLPGEPSAPDITKAVGVKWNELKQSTKPSDIALLKSYQDEAERQKVVYMKAKEEYIPSDDSKIRGGKKVKPDIRRSTTAYMFFNQENRASVLEDNPGIEPKNVMRELGKRWKELKEDPSRAEDLEKYQSLADQDKVRYANEKAQKESKPTSVESDEVEEVEEEQPKNPTPSKKKPTPVKKAPAKKAPAKGNKSSAYKAYATFKRAELKKEKPTLKAVQITSMIGAEWKKLSPEEQDEYNL